MKKKLLALFLLLAPGVCFSQEMHIQDLSAGMFSYISPNKIPDNGAASIQNFFTDIQSMAVERNGSVVIDSNVGTLSKKVPGVWRFVDNSGNEWIIEYSSRTFYKHTVGNTPTQFGLVSTTDNIPRAAVNLGKIMFVNGLDTPWTFDGTSTATVAGAPVGSLIVAWRTRFVIANINGAQSTVRFSADGDATNWTLGGQATDPFSIQIGGANDGFSVKCMGNYLDYLIIQRKYDTWAVSGFDQSDVQNRNVSTEIGCLEPGTNREFDGSYLFLSWRGMEEMQGFQIKPISEPIRNITDIIVKNSSNQRSNTYTSQADWQTGTITGDLSATASAGDLSALTTSYSQTSLADWNSETQSQTFQHMYIDTTSSTGDLKLTFPDTFTSFRDGTSGTKNVWQTIKSLSTGDCSTVPPHGSAGVVSGALTMTSWQESHTCPPEPGTFLITNVITVQTVEQTYDTQQGTTVQFTITGMPTSSSSNNHCWFALANSPLTSADDPGTRGGEFFYRFLSTSAGTAYINNAGDCNGSSTSLYTGTAFSLPATVQVWESTSTFAITINGVTNKSGSGGCGNQNAYVYFSMYVPNTTTGTFTVDNFGIAPEEFSLTSSLDTGITTPIWGGFTATSADNGGTARFFSSVSSNTLSYDAEVSATNGSALTSAKKRYVKLRSRLQLLSPTGTTPTISDYSYNAGSSGTYTSGLINTGSSISSYGPVTIGDSQVGGSITYQVGSTNTANISAITNWTTIVGGGVPSVTPSSYTAFRMFPSQVNSGTGTAKTSDFTISWNEGGLIPAPVSTTYDRRYWISLTTNSASSPVQDTVLVYQRNHTWVMLKGISAASFALWRDNLMFGDSNATGKVFQYDVGNSDNGTDITSSIVSKSYDMGLFNKDKDYRNTYLTFYGGASGSFSLGFRNDQQTTFYSLGTANMTDGTGQVFEKYPFPLDGSVPLQGRELQYVLTKSGSGDRLKLFDILLDFTPKEAR